jgi:hypothetical protein
MRFWQIVYVAFLIFTPTELRAAPTYPCAMSGPRYQLAADTVSWTMTIGSGQGCIQGLRFNNVVIENVQLVTAPKSGEAGLQGPGFTYTANPTFRGEDSFVVKISGSINRLHGSSTIRIAISVVGAPPAVIKANKSGTTPIGPPNYILDEFGGRLLDENNEELTAF